jgi:hypothetical protein
MGPDQRGCVVQPWPSANRLREEQVDKARPFKIPKREVWDAFKRVKANQGAAGVDGRSIREFEANLSGNLYKLWNRLLSGSYFPPVLTSSNPLSTLHRRFACARSLNRACRDLVPTFPQRSPPWLLTTAACGSLRSAPDCLPRRALLHLSYSYAPSYSDGARDT